MTLFTSIAGWAAFGLGARLWQLGVMMRPLHSNLWGHGLAMGSFGAVGYYAYFFQIRMREVLTEQRHRVEARNTEDAVRKTALITAILEHRKRQSENGESSKEASH